MNTNNWNASSVMVYLGVARLKDFIRQIRNCKTLAEERAVISKESAAIRTFFKENSANADLRHVHVAKLLYIHMLGFQAHFGQVESVKLVASPRFTDKRLGYLAVMLLLDENQEVLTLVTNSLQNDLNHPNIYVIGLALSALGNIASPAMLRDLHDEVIRLLSWPNSYIRKKAALCAIQVVKKCPELAPSFIQPSKAFINERNHGALLTGLELITELCRIGLSGTDEDAADYLDDCRRNMIAPLLRHLKGLVTAGYSPDHDVSGITDPFLQCSVLKLLRVLGTSHPPTSELINDVLTQVATSTDSTKNVGNAILYETVLTILEIPADPTLRVVAINILGKFLANRDNNVRYVALQTLNKTVLVDRSANAIQRHRSTILDCLRDPDISIRKRALELSFALITPQNIRLMIRELLNFLETRDPDDPAQPSDSSFKPGMVTNICNAADKFAPNRRWHIDTIIRVMRIAGNYVREDAVSSFVRLVANTPELHGYTVSRLYSAMIQDDGIKQEGLVQAGLWMLGEFGDVLVRGDVGEVVGEDAIAPSEDHVLDVIENALATYAIDTSNTPTTTVKEYALTALAKLAVRFADSPSIVKRIRKMVTKNEASLDVEIQQRASEYMHVLELDDSIRHKVLDRIPVLEMKQDDRPVFGQPGDDDIENMPDRNGRNSQAAVSHTNAVESESLLDLDASGPNKAADARRKDARAVDLLEDIFGSGGDSQPKSAPPAKPGNPLDDILGDGSGHSDSKIAQANGSSGRESGGAPTLLEFLSTSSPPGTKDSIQSSQKVTSPTTGSNQTTPSIEAYNNNGLTISLQASKPAGQPEFVLLQATFNNSNFDEDITDVSLSVAVPKTQKIQIKPIENSTVAAMCAVRQQMRIHNPQQSPLRLRLRISYTQGGQQVQEIKDFSGFPNNFR